MTQLILLNHIIERKSNSMSVISVKMNKSKITNVKKNKIMQQKELFHCIGDNVCTSCLTSPTPLVLDFSYIDPVLSFLSIQNVDCKYTNLEQIWHFMAHSKTGRNEIQLSLPDFEYPFRCQPTPLHIPRIYIASFKCEVFYMNIKSISISRSKELAAILCEGSYNVRGI